MISKHNEEVEILWDKFFYPGGNNSRTGDGLGGADDDDGDNNNDNDNNNNNDDNDDDNDNDNGGGGYRGLRLLSSMDIDSGFEKKEVK